MNDRRLKTRSDSEKKANSSLEAGSSSEYRSRKKKNLKGGFQIHYITEEEKQAAIAEYYAWEEQFSHLNEGRQLVLVVPDEENIDKPVLDSVTDQLNTTPTSEEKSRCTGDHKQTDDKEEKGPLCRICREGHHGLEYCAWRERVPMDATEVGKGFEIICHLCGSLDNKCKHNWSHAVEVFCRICNVEGDHSELECPKLPERAKDEARVEAKKAKKKAAKARARARAKDLKDGQLGSSTITC
ncbi:hypothetical protein D8674_022677 [Pyrus ussuriensis x Pyrus communis]|uniref:Uncharacterized protein n=1 Tax=Pyrus ussuriensis x Pyrus communis TaxID=2448454 RepID=A0A5N5GKM4_9ROSA|nr:hypothetical protein D8674_022677 [Pyrus ussuriensis x Pyrus communis]